MIIYCFSLFNFAIMVVIRQGQSSVCKHDIHIYKILITNFHLSKVYNASRLLIVCYFPDRSMPLRLVFLAQGHIVNKEHVVLCSSTAWLTTAVASVNGILQQPVHAVLHLTFSRKFRKQPLVTISFSPL